MRHFFVCMLWTYYVSCICFVEVAFVNFFIKRIYDDDDDDDNDSSLCFHGDFHQTAFNRKHDRSKVSRDRAEHKLKFCVIVIRMRTDTHATGSLFQKPLQLFADSLRWCWQSPIVGRSSGRIPPSLVRTQWRHQQQQQQPSRLVGGGQRCDQSQHQ